MCTCDILWPEVQSHSDDSYVHATGLHSACVLAQAHPTSTLFIQNSFNLVSDFLTVNTAEISDCVPTYIHS